MKRSSYSGFLLFALLAISAVCPLLAGVLFLVLAKLSMIDIDL